MAQNKIKLAVFDVDGTIFDGNLGIEFVKKLVSDKIFSDDIGNKIFEWYKKYKNGEVEKSIAVDNCYKYYNDGLKGHSTNEIRRIAEETWSLVKEKIYSFSDSLIELLRTNGFKVILLSGSPIEMVSLLGKDFEFNPNDVISGISEINNGIYTGHSISYPGSSADKIEAINNYILENKFHIDWKNSFAFGDNERDLEILERVGFAFAINANELLKKSAKKKGFHMVDQNTILKECIKVLS